MRVLSKKSFITFSIHRSENIQTLLLGWKRTCVSLNTDEFHISALLFSRDWYSYRSRVLLPAMWSVNYCFFVCAVTRSVNKRFSCAFLLCLAIWNPLTLCKFLLLVIVKRNKTTGAASFWCLVPWSTWQLSSVYTYSCYFPLRLHQRM